MPAPERLPDSLGSQLFAVREAVELHGVSIERLRRTDLSRPFHGVRSTTSDLDLRERCQAALLRVATGSFICGPTAALLYGTPLPRRHEVASTIHVAIPRPGRAPRGAGITGHSFDLRLAPVREISGLRVAAPARTWTDLAAAVDLEHLVIAGDHLVRWDLKICTVTDLQREVERSKGRRGRSMMAAALAMLDTRSQSRYETKLRLLLSGAGLTGLAANHEVTVSSGHRYRLDIAMPELLVGIEFQGAHHADPAQYRADQTRMERLRADGWLILEVNARDFDEPIELLNRIRRAIARHLAVREQIDRSQIVA